MAVRIDRIDPSALEVVIVPMRRRHLKGVLRIENQVYPRPWSAGLFMGELALRGSRLYLVARVGTEVVGYAGLMTIAGEGHVTTIAVDPWWHRCGIGTRLLLALARQGVSRSIDALTLEVRTSNHGAQELYRRFGFAPAGIRKNYYAESNEDAIVMWAHDVSSSDYSARLDAIEATIPGSTVHEGLW